MSGPCCGMDAELLVRNAILIPVSQHPSSEWCLVTAGNNSSILALS